MVDALAGEQRADHVEPFVEPLGARVRVLVLAEALELSVAAAETRAEEDAARSEPVERRQLVRHHLRLGRGAVEERRRESHDAPRAHSLELLQGRIAEQEIGAGRRALRAIRPTHQEEIGSQREQALAIRGHVAHQAGLGLHHHGGDLVPDDVVQLARNSFEASFLDEAAKARYQSELSRF